MRRVLLPLPYLPIVFLFSESSSRRQGPLIAHGAQALVTLQEVHSSVASSEWLLHLLGKAPPTPNVLLLVLCSMPSSSCTVAVGYMCSVTRDTAARLPFIPNLLRTVKTPTHRLDALVSMSATTYIGCNITSVLVDITPSRLSMNPQSKVTLAEDLLGRNLGINTGNLSSA